MCWPSHYTAWMGRWASCAGLLVRIALNVPWLFFNHIITILVLLFLFIVLVYFFPVEKLFQGIGKSSLVIFYLEDSQSWLVFSSDFFSYTSILMRNTYKWFEVIAVFPDQPIGVKGCIFLHPLNQVQYVINRLSNLKSICEVGTWHCLWLTRWWWYGKRGLDTFPVEMYKGAWILSLTNLSRAPSYPHNFCFG